MIWHQFLPGSKNSDAVSFSGSIAAVGLGGLRLRGSICRFRRGVCYGVGGRSGDATVSHGSSSSACFVASTSRGVSRRLLHTGGRTIVWG